MCQGIQTFHLQNSIIISIAAGTLGKLSQLLPELILSMRAMPNTPCLVNKGVTVLISNQKRFKKATRDRVNDIFCNVGQVFWVIDENQIDTATAISGSGPAYFYYFSENMIAAAIKLGMPEALARELVEQTLLGSALLKQDSKDSLSSKTKVTSKGGTTGRNK